MEDVKIVNGENLKVVPGNGIVVITKLMRIRMKCRIVNSLRNVALQAVDVF